MGELLTVKEAAEVLRVTTKTIHNLARRGEIRKSKVGRCTRIRQRELERLLDRRPTKKRPGLREEG